jgi:hypothetical protein
MQLADDKLGVKLNETLKKCFCFFLKIILQEQNYFIHNPPPFVICQLQAQNGDFTKTAC